jgi:CBS domain-containing protein
MNVENLMSRHVKTCSAHDTLDVAARIMWDSDLGIVPVIDDGGGVVAVVTDRDICMAGVTQGLPYRYIPVLVAASKTLVSVQPSDGIEKAEDLMRTCQVRRLPVVSDGGQIVGILSLNDLARRSGRRADDLPADEVAWTLMGICLRPHAPHAPNETGRAPHPS